MRPAAGPLEAPLFIAATGRLRADNAVAALLLLEDGRYVMQLRDAKPHIFYPDHWGCFGGAVHEGEDPLRTLHRELQEELEFTPHELLEFTRFDFDFGPLGHKSVYRIYYAVPVSRDAFSRFVLHEGAEFRAFSAAEILLQPRVTPYDAFAIWMHCRRERFLP
jgi:8-oxo-dGTP pyrophosphatase MutT (NUDIX family)